MTTGPTLSYDEVCRIAGRLYLESQQELERAALAVRDAKRQVEAAQAERDQALHLLQESKK